MGKRKKRVVIFVCGAVVLLALVIAGISRIGQQNQADRALYDQYAMETQKDFAELNESIGQLANGGQLPQDTVQMQYDKTLAALENWNQVFPEFSRKGELPYVDSMNDRRLEEEDALAVITEKMENLFDEVSDTYYGTDPSAHTKDAEEEIAVLADEVRSNMIIVCKRLSRAE